MSTIIKRTNNPSEYCNIPIVYDGRTDPKSLESKPKPPRLIVRSSKNGFRRYLRELYCNAIMNIGEDSKIKDQEKFVLELYDQWLLAIMAYKSQSVLSMTIFFDDTRPEGLHSKWSPSKNILFYYVNPSWLDVRSAEDSSNLINRLSNVNIFRHVEYNKYVEKAAEGFKKSHSGAFFFYEHQTFHNSFFSMLCSLPIPSFVAGYVIRQIFEAALMRVLVIDDRIANYIANKEPEECKTKIDALKAMGIDVVGKIRIKDNEIPFVKESTFDTADFSDSEYLSQYDILFIHQTLFEKAIEPSIDCLSKKNREGWIEELKEKIPIVVFHSGRGKAQDEKMPGNVKFMEYSTIHKYIIAEPSKYFLAGLAINSTEGMI